MFPRRLMGKEPQQILDLESWISLDLAEAASACVIHFDVLMLLIKIDVNSIAPETSRLVPVWLDGLIDIRSAAGRTNDGVLNGLHARLPGSRPRRGTASLRARDA